MGEVQARNLTKHFSHAKLSPLIFRKLLPLYHLLLGPLPSLEIPNKIIIWIFACELEMINSNSSHSSSTVHEAQSETLEYRRFRRDRNDALHVLVAQLVLPVTRNSCYCACGLFPQCKMKAGKAELPVCSEESGCLWWTGWKIVFFLFLPFVNNLYYTVKTCSGLLSQCQSGQLNLLAVLLYIPRVLSTHKGWRQFV